MNIAILGGSFDPPHNGHKLIAQQILKHLDIEEVWLMPVCSHPFNKNLSSPHQRLEMAKLLENKKIRVSDFEIKQRKVSYSIDTLNHFSKNLPNYQFFWIIGAEHLETFKKWKRWKELTRNYSLIIFPREPYRYELEKKVKKFLSLVALPKNIILMDQKNLLVKNVSSTIIRERVKKGLPITHLVPKRVERYIKNHNIYSL